ncbi:MAG: SOS response-associated peptidase [Gemmataceae bacterium]|nr:SOS response-associated peptidase [Gemmataceae bacterium]
MCGRFTLAVPAAEVAEILEVAEVPDLKPRYNIAPSQPVLACRTAPDGHREVTWLKWGLVPFWADDPKIGYRLINARSETIAAKPSFRDAYRKRRCVVPADGFYEWKPRGKTKQPYRFYRPDGKPFLIAALWERWEPTGQAPLETCTLITTEANDLLRRFHDRMPVLFDAASARRWLTPGPLDQQVADELLRPAPNDWLTFHAVATRVNDPKVDDPSLIEPIDAPD